tara:strand:- start:44 stop:547 length:504 start_codon:yes stop_codon:yes gene_type:complete
MIYELGHIYVIWDIDDHNLVYYGSTNDLKYRMYRHKSVSNSCSSKQIIERGNYEYAILETHENIDKYDLIERERWYIENKPCINKTIPHRTRAEYSRKYRQDNKEKLTDYYQNNKDKFAQHNSKYYQNNKEKKFVCECGAKLKYLGKSQHEKSKKHQRYINIANQLL